MAEKEENRLQDMGSATCQIDARSAGEVAMITMLHPGKMNAMGSAMLADLMQIFADLENRENLRVVVLTGAGDKTFVGGAFVPELHALNSETGKAFITRLHLMHKAVRDCPVPVIARLRGYCIGAGTELATSCDFRVADKSVIFGMPEVKVGMPSVIEAALLPMLVGWGKAREMMMTGGNYSAEEGQTMGFLDTVVEAGELDDMIETRINQILAAGPLAVRAQKSLMRAWEEMTPAEGIALGIDYMGKAYETDEPQRMMAPLLDKEKSK